MWRRNKTSVPGMKEIEAEKTGNGNERYRGYSLRSA
jgi:hypothetical protein